MKTIKRVAIIAIVVIISLLIYDRQINYYTMKGIVYEIDGDVLVLLDSTDNLWEIDYTDTLKVGDKIKIEFHTNYTDDERIDDKITAIIKQ